MSKFTVTQLGKVKLLPSIELTADVIELTNGSMNMAWTMQATHNGNRPVDAEGYTPWPYGLTVEDALEREYIKELS